jgi:hypothetical protein
MIGLLLSLKILSYFIFPVKKRGIEVSIFVCVIFYRCRNRPRASGAIPTPLRNHMFGEASGIESYPCFGFK